MQKYAITDGFNGFASESSRTMLKQHLGNQPDAMYGNGVMETYDL